MARRDGRGLYGVDEEPIFIEGIKNLQWIKVILGEFSVALRLGGGMIEKYISGKNIALRDVEVDDAAFILSLRLDERLNQFISKTEADVERQRQWIINYKSGGDSFYFIIQGLSGAPYGTVRIYDLRDNSFCWGSWIVAVDAPSYVAIESALLVYEFGFYKLGFAQSHFDVRKENQKVVNFHKRFGARIVGEDELNYYFVITREDYAKAKVKYRKYLQAV